MADPTIPPDLLDKLARATYDDGAYCGLCAYEGWDDCVNCRGTNRSYALGVLAALAEWADGALIDPTTWQRVTAVVVGRERCVTHDDDCSWYPFDGCTLVPLYVLTREDPT